MHHAWLLAGPVGSGVRDFACAAAAELVEATTAGEHHPDILHLKREPKDAAEIRKQEEGKPFDLARSISIAQIRKLQQRLTTRPTFGKRRAIIIDTVDDLETAAANAMLKSLEEPPAGTVFLLICHHPARLLPTIRSRCRVLRFAAEGRTAIDEDGAPIAEERAATGLADILGYKRPATRDDAHNIAGTLGARPSREKLQAALELSRAKLVSSLAASDLADLAALDSTYQELVRLQGELATYNYDPDLLAARIAALLASVRGPIAAANG